MEFYLQVFWNQELQLAYSNGSISWKYCWLPQKDTLFK